MKIDFANLQLQYQKYKSEIDQAIQTVLDNSHYILGEEVPVLEQNLAKFTGAKNAISCSNGTDALLLAMMALDIKPGDEVITPPFTFIATAETIAFMGAVPVFVDIDKQTYNIDANKIAEKITDKTVAIMPVSLFGQPADIDTIQTIADQHDLKVIVDGAQSFGSSYQGVTDSCMGDISTTSFFPAKPLGCYGDGGAVFTNDNDLALKIKQLRVHGQNKKYHHKYIGMGGRLDTIQAAVLNTKLKHYPDDLLLRQQVAAQYDVAMRSIGVTPPVILRGNTSAYAQYSIQVNNRDTFQKRLQKKGIPTAIYYPKPLHLQECFEYLNHKKGDFPISEEISAKIISLPMNPYLKNDQIAYISDACAEALE